MRFVYLESAICTNIINFYRGPILLFLNLQKFGPEKITDVLNFDVNAKQIYEGTYQDGGINSVLDFHLYT